MADAKKADAKKAEAEARATIVIPDAPMVPRLFVLIGLAFFAALTLPRPLCALSSGSV